MLVVAVLPLLGVGGMQLYKAETPGPVKDEKLTPRITETAKALWFTYLAITAAGVVGLRVAGMSWFDAICHGFSAIALGGFSTHDVSVGYFESFAVELVLIVIMVVAALNFSRHFLAFRNLSLQALPQRIPRARPCSSCWAPRWCWCRCCCGSTALIPRRMEGFRHSVFNVVSIATTTGFVTEDYEKWPAFLPVWLLFLSCITCSTGSTGGGIKMFRTLLLVRQARRELKLLVHPERGDSDPHRWPCDSRSRGVLGAGVHLPVFRHDPGADFRAAGHRPRPGVVVLGGGRIDQQRGPGPRRGGPVDELFGAD